MNRNDLPPHVPVTLGYDHRYRLVYVTDVRQSNEGKTLITGWDPDAEGFRTFRADRLKGLHILKNG